MKQYNPHEIEPRWQKAWEDADLYKVTEDHAKPKKYVLEMFPYPSGDIHMGHVRNYTIGDVIARYSKMRGFDVLHPMGWDAFGLPAENAAIKHHSHPAKWTYANIETQKASFKRMGLSYDWDRTVVACDPEYYRWGQWIFLQFWKRGLVERRNSPVNWCPKCQTVLANEQVIDGRGWRSGAVVERKEIPGYYLGITQYAQELLDDIDKLDGWPDQVRAMQRHWIGRSEGVDFAFPYTLEGEEHQLRVYTTRADTIMGVTFVAVAAEHPLAKYAAKSDPAVAAFVAECAKGSVSEADMATKEKKGIKTNLTVRHPITGADVPVWVGNYVLMTYGEGAVMGVPAHDERDFSFAKRYGIEIRQAVNLDGVPEFTTDHWQEWYGDKTLNPYCVNSGKYDGLHFHEAIVAIAADLKAKGLGEKHVQFRLRDWSISRQRYWGTPIPMINCPKCGAVPVPEEDLPVVLPENEIPDGSGNPLAKDPAFLNVTCPKCGGPAQRETDTMDTFVDSSWYFMRYCSPDCDTAMVDSRNDYWNPMDQYIGGIEHAVLHLLYARFWTKVMRDLGLVKFDEPFKRLFTQGMLCAEAFYRELPDGHVRWYYPDEIEVKTDEKGRPTGAIAKEDGQPVKSAGIQKMSKSKCNVVEPRDIIKKYGADTARTFVMFAGPPDQSAAWSNAGAEGTFRFLRRLWSWTYAKRDELASAGAFDPKTATADQKNLRRSLYQNVAQATADLDRMQYNTVVSAAMKMMNEIDSFKDDGSAGSAALLRESLSLLLRVLYPLAPHITTSLWDELGYVKELGEIIDSPWPKVDPEALAADEIQLVVQVNGKLRGRIMVSPDASREEIEKTALADADVSRFLGDTPVKKVIIVPKRLVNIVAPAPKA